VWIAVAPNPSYSEPSKEDADCFAEVAGSAGPVAFVVFDPANELVVFVRIGLASLKNRGQRPSRC
jgi:hypothetical protein